MRGIAALFAGHLLMMSLSPFGIVEFLRTGSLAAHWKEHQAIDPELGFGEFMVLHYFDAEHNGDDPADHAKLPFHHHGMTAMVFFPGEMALHVMRTTQHTTTAFVQVGQGKPIGISIPIFRPPQG